ncbi:MAG TPA: GNAT family N-acetyltransferase [Symbiobacteriaceae bacterium]|nr:GNAT family N-acetyltransferase [Symbiobacteriaceae bacterium]
MEVLIREVAPGELPEAVDLYLAARHDMHMRQGHAPGPISEEDRVQNLRGYRHIHQTGILRVAEADGRLAGVCAAVVRDNLWFLSGFWVHPALQGQGVGGPLLREVWNAGAARGAETFCVWASSDPTAMATYMKRGMLPGYQILAFGGAVTAMPPAPAGYDEEELPLTTAVAFDERVRATGREVDHLYWQLLPGCSGTLVTRGEKPVGYFYRRGGVIGPVVWLEPADGGAVLALAIRQAAAGAPEIKLWATGAVPDAIRIALGAGLKLTGHSHFLTTAPFGLPDRYLPSGPLLY